MFNRIIRLRQNTETLQLDVDHHSSVLTLMAHMSAAQHTCMQNEEQQSSSVRAGEQRFNVCPRAGNKKRSCRFITQTTANIQTGSTRFHSYLQSQISLTFQLNTSYHHRPPLSAVIYTHRPRGEDRGRRGRAALNLFVFMALQGRR